MNCIRRKVEREKEGCKKCKRRRRLRERRKRGDRGGELIDDLGNYLRPFVYSFFSFLLFSSIPFFRLLPRVSSYCPERGIVFHPPPPLLCPQSLFHEVFACSTRSWAHILFRAIFFYHHLAASPPLTVFSRMDGWAVHSPVTTGPCSLIKNNRRPLSPFARIISCRIDRLLNWKKRIGWWGWRFLDVEG